MCLCRLSNAADRAAEARNHLSGGSFELNPAIAMQPVKRLSEELAAALKARNSWTATVAPFPNAMKADPKSASVRSSMDASSSSRVGAVHGVAAEVTLGPPLCNPEQQCAGRGLSNLQTYPVIGCFTLLETVSMLSSLETQGACTGHIVPLSLVKPCSYH